MADPAQTVNPQVLNLQQRAAVLSNSVKMTQPLFSGTFDPSQQNVINIPPRNVGLIMGFLIEVTATLTNGGGTQANRTGFGSANLLSNITFNDLNNNVRVNCSGRYLAILDSARQGWAYGGAYANNLAMGYGNNWNVNQGAANLAAGADGAVRHIYYLPMAYSPSDLRGAIYAGVVSAQMNLQLTINKTPFVGAGDPLNAIYSGNAAGGFKNGTGVDIAVYQIYLDQLPQMNGGPLLPMLDLNNIYELKESTYTGVPQGQDFPIPYSSYREFLSTTAIYDNAGVFNTGSDVNYWALVAANTTQLWKLSPEIAALLARQTFMADPPPGTYYFDHRDRPINTIAFGNMQLVLNASDAEPGAKVVIGTEAFAQVSTLMSTAASSLAQ